MLILAIESSSLGGSVALLRDLPEGAEVLAAETLPTGERSASSLFTRLEGLLNAFENSRQDIGLVCVTSGPGSFTGLRVGIAAAKMLAFAWQVPAIGVSSLEVISSQAFEEILQTSIENDEKVFTIESILDAQRQEVYVGKFQAQRLSEGHWGELGSLEEPRIVGRKDWADSLSVGTIVAGPALKQVASILSAEVKQGSAAEPQATMVGKLGLKKWKAGEPADPARLLPQYVRASAAEEKAASKKE